MNSFRRYTNLAATLHMLQTRKITLLNPENWDDKNDAYFMSEYKRLKNAKSVLALCFAEHPETYHHWRVFSHGNDGVCINFDKKRLLTVFQEDSDVKFGSVNYKLIRDMNGNNDLKLEQLPFIKRKPYKDEREFRILYSSYVKSEEYKHYKIDLNCMKRITLSPWISVPLYKSVKEILKGLCNDSNIKIVRSTLIGNEEWKKVTSRVQL